MGVFPQLKGRALYGLMKLVCGSSFMMYGYDAGVLGGVLLHKPFLDAIGNPTGVWIIPMIASSYTAAACVTALCVSTFAFRIGRRWTVLMGCIAAVVGSIIQSTSWSVGQLIAGRCVTGFAIGSISSAVPIYLAETGVEVGDRGPANALNAIMLIGGVPLAYWIDYGFIKMNNQISWRLPILFQCIFAIFSGICMFFLPDTPRWYYARHREAEGDAVLTRLNDSTMDDIAVQKTKQGILVAIEAELEATSSLRWQQFLTMGLTDKTQLKIVLRLCICFWIPMLQEWMGCSLLAYFCGTILVGTGAQASLVSLLAGIMTLIFALGCVPLYWTVERLGRRSILMYGAAVMGLLMLIFVILQAIPPTSAIQWASYAVLCLFMFVSGYAWQGCVWLYVSEIAPLEYRHIGAAATAFGQWLMTFITTFAGPIGLSEVGWKLWIWTLAGCVVSVVYVYFLCPETGGLTLEEIDFIFSKDAPTFKSAQLNNENEKGMDIEIENITD